MGMQQNALATVKSPYRKFFLGTDASDASFTNPIPTTTQPSTGFVAVPIGANFASVMLYGENSNGDLINYRFWTSRKTTSVVGTTLWVPRMLCEVACTLSAITGIAAAEVVNTEFFVDTISKTTSPWPAFIEVWSPENDTIAEMVFDCRGVDMLGLTADLNTGATLANGLVAFF